MARRVRVRLTLAAAALLSSDLLVAAPLRVHETWLLVSKTSAGRRLAELGTGDRFPVSDSPVEKSRIARTLVRIGRTSTGSLSNPKAEGKATRLDLTFQGRGVATVAVELQPRAITIPAAEFEAYLQEIGADEAREERLERKETKLPGREVYQKLPKTFVEMGESAVMTPPVGLPLELVVQQHPFQLRAKDSLVLTVLREGKPLARQLVRAFGEDGKVFFSGKTDEGGQLAVPLPRAGRVLLTATAIRRLPEAKRKAGAAYSGADWESHWASLVLTVKPK